METQTANSLKAYHKPAEKLQDRYWRFMKYRNIARKSGSLRDILITMFYVFFHPSHSWGPGEDLAELCIKFGYLRLALHCTRYINPYFDEDFMFRGRCLKKIAKALIEQRKFQRARRVARQCQTNTYFGKVYRSGILDQIAKASGKAHDQKTALDARREL